MRIAILFVLVLVNYVLQTTLFPEIAILGVTPDTALVLIVSYAILRGDIEGALFGLFAGFVQDASGGMFIGIYALLGFVTGYVCGKPFRTFFKDNYFLPFFIIVFASFTHQFLLYVTTILFTGQVEFLLYLRTIILPTMIYTASLSIPFYAFMYFVNAMLERYERNFGKIFRDGDKDE